MTLQQLKYVIAISEKRSINEAAKVLFVSQPTLTNAIRELEKEIGITVFVRTNKGVHITSEGEVFLSYARQVIEQMKLLEDKYLSDEKMKEHFQVSAQHYNFVVTAFSDLVREVGLEEYELALSEKKTYDIIEDVRKGRSEIGVLFLSDFNKSVIMRILKESNLTFKELYVTKPYIFVSKTHPLAVKDKVSIEDLDPYPYIYFEQGEQQSFYFAEEVISTFPHKKSIRVTDRATCFNLIMSLNGYTPSVGIYQEALGQDDLLPIPLDIDETIHLGYITIKGSIRSMIGARYIELLETYLVNEK